MLRITTQNAIPLRNARSFKGSEFGSDAYKEQQKAQRFEELAQIASESAPSTLKSFTIVTALMSASALTGAAVSGRFFDALNGMGALKKLTPKVPVALEYLKTKVNGVNLTDATKLKKTVTNASKALLESLDNLSKSGVESKLTQLNAKKARRIQKIGRKIKKENPTVQYSKEQLSKLVQEYIEQNPKQKEFFDDLILKANDFKGSNLSKKITKSTAATAMGIGALTEAAKDVDSNGIPDCVEYSRAKKESTQKLTAALIDCALDSI